MERRTFIKGITVASTGAVISIPLIQPTWANSPNESVNIAVVGIRSRGKDHIRTLAKIPNVNIVALCDIDKRLLPDAVELVEKLTGKKPQTETDFRKLIERKDIDAVSLATPNHWHALQTIWACQAGKDVYVEKPVSPYRSFEGKEIYGRRWIGKNNYDPGTLPKTARKHRSCAKQRNS